MADDSSGWSESVTIRLDERVVLVTGAGGGIGRAQALRLSARGARVVVNNRHHDEPSIEDRAASRVVAEIEDAGGEALADYEDASAHGAGARMVRHALDRYGRLDAVICNAGIAPKGMFHQLSLEAIRETIAVNLMGVLEVIHAALRPMRDAGRGRIVVNSSSSALGDVGYAAYATSKTAMHGLVRCLALENEGKNVKVNAIMPFARTRMTEAHFVSGFFPSESGDCLTPEAIAELTTVLVSRQCPTNGALIAIAGGIARRLDLVQGQGLQIDSRRPDADRFLAEFDRVVDLGDAITYASGGEMLLDLADRNVRNRA